MLQLTCTQITRRCNYVQGRETDKQELKPDVRENSKSDVHKYSNRETTNLGVWDIAYLGALVAQVAQVDLLYLGVH